METRFTFLLGSISRFFFYLIILLMPLVALPLYGDRFELTKYFFFIFLTLLSGCFLLARMVMLKKLEWKKSPLDVPVCLLGVFYVVSSLLSQHYYISFVGNFNFLGISGLVMISTVVFYFLCIQHTSHFPGRVRTMFFLSLFSGGAAALYTILRATGIIQTNAIFSPTLSLVSSSNVLSGVFFAGLAASALVLLSTKSNTWSRQIFAGSVALLSLVAMALLGFKISWVLFGGAMAVGLIFLLTYFDGIKQAWFSLIFALLIVALLFVILNINQVFSLSLPTEIFLGFKTSWSVALQTLRLGVEQFFFGNGPETYGYVFNNFRPGTLSTTILSNWQFTQSGTAMFQFLTVSGVMSAGMLVVIFLWVAKIIFGTWRSHLLRLRANKLILTTEGGAEVYVGMAVFWAYTLGWLVLLATFWILNIGMVQWIGFWFLTAGIVTSASISTNEEISLKTWSLRTSSESVLAATFGFITLLTAVSVGLIYMSRFFAAEIIFAQSLGKPMPEKIAALQGVIRLNHFEAKFYNVLSKTLLQQAADWAKTGVGANKVYEEVTLAVDAAKKATYYAPGDAQNWYNLGVVYVNVAPLFPEANIWAVRSLQEAIVHDPKNGGLYLAKAVVETADKKYTNAVGSLQKSIEFNPTLLESYVRLAALKDMDKDVSSGITILESGLVNGGNASPQYLFELAVAYFKRHGTSDVVQAEKYVRQAVSLNNNYANALYVLALIDEEKNNIAEAFVIYQRLAELNPDSKEVQKKLINLARKIQPSLLGSTSSTKP